MEVIKVENLSKLYDLGQVGTGTISKDLNRWWAQVRGKDDPYAKIGNINDRTRKSEKDESVWALKDISFSVNQGDVVGIIGRNGAGKSTLLKIISRITTPSSGAVKVKGRIASLLEVGTGFHPEMTGRENIFMNGTLLGMTRREIQGKLDQIINFAGVEMYINTPVKRYSSGMQVRLAFAVAAFLEPEILIVDEVLAVGDAEFQKKAIGRMQEVSNSEGRTVLFVSHNMQAIQRLCSTSILLEHGRVVEKGLTSLIIEKYLESNNNNKSYSNLELNHTKDIPIVYATKIVLEDLDGKMLKEIPIGRPWCVKVFFTINIRVENIVIGLGMVDAYETPVRNSWSQPTDFEPGQYVISFIESNILFASGIYKLLIGISKGSQVLQYIDDALVISFSEIIDDNQVYIKKTTHSIVLNQMSMNIEKI